MPSKRSAESTPQRGSKRLKEHTPEAKRARLYQAVDASRKEIRLLVVAAGAKDDPVRGTFRHVSLLDDPKPVSTHASTSGPGVSVNTGHC